MNITNKTAIAQLKALEEAVINLLTISKTLGNVYIITNAMKGWVEYSSEKWIPGAVAHLEGIPIVSARYEYEEQFPGNFHQWKVEAFLEMTQKFETTAVTNLVALGDSTIELDAAHHLVKCYSNAVIKTVKFRESPTPEELVK